MLYLENVTQDKIDIARRILNGEGLKQIAPDYKVTESTIGQRTDNILYTVQRYCRSQGIDNVLVGNNIREKRRHKEGWLKYLAELENYWQGIQKEQMELLRTDLPKQKQMQLAKAIENLQAFVSGSDKLDIGHAYYKNVLRVMEYDFDNWSVTEVKYLSETRSNKND